MTNNLHFLVDYEFLKNMQTYLDNISILSIKISKNLLTSFSHYKKLMSLPKYVLIISFIWCLYIAIDVTFFIYYITNILYILYTSYKNLLTNKKCINIFLALILLFINNYVYFFIVKQFEVSINKTNIQIDINNDYNSTFYRVSNHHLLYNKDIKLLQSLINNNNSITKSINLHENINCWEWDLFQFQFLFKFVYNNKNKFINDYICCIESDVIFNETHFNYILNKIKPDITFVQSFRPSNQFFENINVGIVCINKNILLHNRIYANILMYFYKRKMRRLFPWKLAYSYFKNMYVFDYQKHDGCFRYKKGCKYTHFVNPSKYKKISSTLIKLLIDLNVTRIGITHE